MKNKIKITHIRQMHLPPFQEIFSDKSIEDVAYSQFHVAKPILQYDPKNTLVLEEGLCKEISQDNESESNTLLIKTAKALFPDGLPSQFSDLKSSQKDFLARTTGAGVLFCLGKYHPYFSNT